MDPSARQLQRRSLIGTLGGLAAIGSIAGCLSGPDGTEGDDTAEEPDDPEVELTDLVLVNNHDESHTFHLLIYRNDERIHWYSHEIDSETDVRPELFDTDEATSDGPATYSVAARLDDEGTWKEWSLEPDDGQCVQAMIRVGRDGKLAAWTMTDEC
ncbi:MAG: hypothetical protein ACQETB_10705 [Halobacteriota archaeon]